MPSRFSPGTSLGPALTPSEAAPAPSFEVPESRAAFRSELPTLDAPASVPTLTDRTPEEAIPSRRPADESADEASPPSPPQAIEEAAVETEPARRKKFDPERADAAEEEAPRPARPATVRISIGRVEVRVAETIKPAKPNPRRPNVPSLADYLAGRRGRR